MLLHSPLNAPPLISCRSFSLIWNQPVGQNVHEGPVRLRPPARRVSLLRLLYRCHSPRRSAPWEEPDVLRQRDHSGRQQERHWQQVSRATGQKTLRSRHNSQHN